MKVAETNEQNTRRFDAVTALFEKDRRQSRQSLRYDNNVYLDKN